MTDKEKIRAEIDRLLNKEWKWQSSTEGKFRCETYRELLGFIDSLPEEPYDYRHATITQKDFAEPISEGLEEEIEEYLKHCLAVKFPTTNIDAIKSDVRYIAHYFANWQKEQMEKERLKHCDTLTKEEHEMESDFVIKHLEKYNRTPTFCDAIEYGYRKAVEKATKWIRLNDSYSKPTDLLINDFRKAMGEEK